MLIYQSSFFVWGRRCSVSALNSQPEFGVQNMAQPQDMVSAATGLTGAEAAPVFPQFAPQSNVWEGNPTVNATMSECYRMFKSLKFFWSGEVRHPELPHVFTCLLFPKSTTYRRAGPSYFRQHLIWVWHEFDPSLTQVRPELNPS